MASVVDMLIVRALVFTAALICFIIASLPKQPTRPVIGWVGAGLALWVSVVVWDAWAATDVS